MSMWKKAMAAVMALLLTAAASAEVYTGRTAAARTQSVYAEGTVEAVCAEVGQTVAEGEPLLTLRTRKVFATQDGTVARVLAAEGDTVDGAALEIAPKSLYTVYCTADGAYASAETGLLHPGETVYLRCSVDGTHRAVGVVTNPDGDEYRVETLGGELYVGEAVKLYRDADFSADQCVGVGTVLAAETEEYAAEGIVVRMCVSEGETVERGQLLFEVCASSETTVAAPASGVVTAFTVAPGDEIRSGEAVAALVCSADIRVEIDVDEAQAAALRPGDRVALTFADDPEDESAGGTVEEVLRIAEDGAYRVFIVPDDASNLRIGQTVTVRTEGD